MRPDEARRAVLPVVWVATLGADRIDLLGGHVSVHVTPFLVLTPIVAATELWRRRREGSPVSLGRSMLAYCALLLCLAVVVLASVYVSRETAVSAARATLLVATIAGTLVVILTLPEKEVVGILARGAVLGLALFALFSVLEGLTFLGIAPEHLLAGPIDVDLVTAPYAGIFPRLSGPVIDPNRGGLLVLCYAYALARGAFRPRMRRSWLGVAALLLLLTLSRSAVLAAGVAFVVILAERRRLALGFAPAVVALVLVGAMSVVLLAFPVTGQRFAETVSPFSQRLSAGEGSATTHLALVQRGFATATASVPRALIGLGYGSSYLVLDDIFPGNRYGNFHSLYVSMFAESGVFALLLIVALLVVPLTRRGPYRALVVGLVIFNVFYQATVEPVFWAVLALAWLSMDAHRTMRVVGIHPPRLRS